MIIADCHMHTAFSADSDTPMEEQILAAIRKGLKFICFTDHMDLDTPYEAVPEEERLVFWLDEKEYRRSFLELQKKYAGQIELHYGIEMGLNTRLKRETDEYIISHPEYEFIIGSTHSDFENDPYYPEFFEGMTAQEAVRHWMQTTLENVRAFSFYDTCGHLDYILRNSILYEPEEFLQSLQDQGISYGDYCYEKNKDVIDEILKTLIAKEKCLELNTSALVKSSGKEGLHVHRQPNPCLSILKRYKELGGTKITIGADAHVPSGVGGCFDQAEEILKEAGFDGYYVFRRRVPEFIPFE